MKKLGFGMMRLPLLDRDDPTSIDLEQLKEMVDCFLERGFTYFDTAWMYCGHKSECAVKDALVTRHPRSSYTLATKLHGSYLKSADDCDRIFREQCEKTGVDYFDYYLIHSITRDLYEIYNKFDCFNWIREKKAAGLVRKIGFSFHDDAEFLDQVLTEHPEMEFVQLQLNYLDWESDHIQSRLCYEVARRHGVDIIVMEPVRGGRLANLSPEIAAPLKEAHPDWSVPSWAIRFVAGLDGVFMVLSGMSNTAQLLDNTDYMQSFAPLSDSEVALVMEAAEKIKKENSINCTACSYCTDGCPMEIQIPKIFSLYNEALANSDRRGRRRLYDALDGGKAVDCISCGQCEEVCPQHLSVIKHLQTVAEYFKA